MCAIDAAIQVRRLDVAPGQERQEAGEVRGAVEVDAGDRRAVQRRAGHRHRQVGIDGGDPLDRGDLHLDHAPILGGVGDLEDPGRAGCLDQAEVLVPLADERLGSCLQAERGTRKRLGLAGRQDGWALTSRTSGGVMVGSYPPVVPLTRHEGAIESATVTATGLLPPLICGA